MQQQIGHKTAGRRPPRGRSAGRTTLGRRLAARPWALAAIAILVGVVVLIGATSARPASDPAVGAGAGMAPEVGKLAPTFTLETPEGAALSLESLRGQVVLVNFWATWCPPCRAEMPAIQAAYERYRAQGFTVVAVTANEQPANVTGFFQERGLSFPALLDDGRVHEAYRANGLPASFFIDRQGVVRAVYRGAMSETVIVGAIEGLLAAEPQGR